MIVGVNTRLPYRNADFIAFPVRTKKYSNHEKTIDFFMILLYNISHNMGFCPHFTI